MKKAIIWMVLAMMVSCRGSKLISKEDVVKFYNEQNGNPDVLFCITESSFLNYCHANGNKFKIKNHGIVVVNADFKLLDISGESCSMAKLNEIENFDELSVAENGHLSFSLPYLYPNLEAKVKSFNGYTILALWSKYYGKSNFVKLKDRVGLYAKQQKAVQVLFMNADIDKSYLEGIL